MTYRLHHIHLLCSDLEQMIDFLTQRLGASLVERKKFLNADGASLDLNGTIINLRVAREDEKVQKDGTALQYGFHHIGLVVEDLEKVYRDLSGMGYPFSVTPRETGNNRIAFFTGPDNTIFELLQPLK
jgi:catechol 2,3-dioxygenase-like lactoylglutathione lyase family enzyme